MSCTGESFIEMLKQIGYPDVARLDASSFDWMFDDELLKPVIETLCLDIGEENIVTSEEIAEHNSLPDKMINTTLSERLTLLENENMSEEIQEEVSDLQGDISQMEKYIKLLENHKNLLSIQQIELSQKIEDTEALHKAQQQDIRCLQDTLLPEAIKKMKDALQKSLTLAEELNSAFQSVLQAQDSDNAKTFFQLDFTKYIESEEEVLKNVKHFLNNSFQEYVAQAGAQSTEDKTLECFIPHLSSSDLQKKQAVQMQMLKKFLLMSKEEYVKSLLEVTKLESQIKFCKDLLAKDDVTIYNLPDAQLQTRLEQTQQRLKQSKREEKELQADVSKAMQSKIQRHCNYVTALSMKEKLERYEDYYGNLQKPLDLLFSQRARLEFLQMAMIIEKNDLKDHHSKVQNLRKEIEAEVAEIEKHKVHYAETANEKLAIKESVSEDSVFHVANEILSQKSNKVFVTAKDVEENYAEQKSKKENLIAESEVLLKEQLQWIKTVEKYIGLMEEHIYGNKINAEHPSYLLEDLNASLKKLHIQIQDFEGRLLEEMKNYQKRKTTLAQNSHFEKARKLFVYALTNQEKFETCIKEIHEHKNQLDVTHKSV